MIYNTSLSKEDLLYTAEAVASFFRVPLKKVTKIQKWAFVCLVVIAGRKATFVSLKKFKQAFVDHRKNLARNLLVGREQGIPGAYTVCDPHTGRRGHVRAFKNQLQCGCEDFKRQIHTFGGRGCCQHGYAVIFQEFNLSSLAEYVAQQTGK